MSERVEVDIYFDYACPYVNSAALWMAEVVRQLSDSAPVITWKFFPLEQVNAPEDAETAVWDLPVDRRSRGRDSLHAAAAARRQGNDAFERFHYALLALKHEEGQDHGVRAVLEEAATRARLDLDRYRADLADRSVLNTVRDEYTAGHEQFSVFGTPTFVFPNGNSAYVQTLPPPPAEEAVPMWEDFVTIVRDRPYLREIKRPRRPS
ncbi:MAG: DsbA family protein [Thermomicrobiales bacterium]